GGDGGGRRDPERGARIPEGGPGDPTMTRRARILSGLAVLAAGAGIAAASSPVVWEHPARLLPTGRPPAVTAPRDGRPPSLRIEPRPDGVAVGEGGRLTLSVPLREMFPGSSDTPPPPLIWTAIMDGGGQVHLGTGNMAELISFDKKGTLAEGIDMDDFGVRALVAAPDGDLFLGTFPNGDVYRITKGKDPETWVELDERYIWSMVMDSQQRLYIGTGERGIIYRATSRGQKDVIFDSDQAHITSLALSPKGDLFAGTDP